MHVTRQGQNKAAIGIGLAGQGPTAKNLDLGIVRKGLPELDSFQRIEHRLELFFATDKAHAVDDRSLVRSAIQQNKQVSLAFQLVGVRNVISTRLKLLVFILLNLGINLVRSA